MNQTSELLLVVLVTFGKSDFANVVLSFFGPLSEQLSLKTSTVLVMVILVAFNFGNGFNAPPRGTKH